MDQTMMESLLRVTPNHPDVSGKKRLESSRQKIRFMRKPLQGSLPVSTIDVNLFGREGDQTFLLQTMEQFSASHVLEGTVGLMPVPDST